MSEINRVGPPPVIPEMPSKLPRKTPDQIELKQKNTPAETDKKEGDENKSIEPLASITYDNSGRAVLNIGPIPNKFDSEKSNIPQVGEEEKRDR